MNNNYLNFSNSVFYIAISKAITYHVMKHYQLAHS